MLKCCYIKDLNKKLDEINRARIKSREKDIILKDWSSFVSGFTMYKVCQFWIVGMTRKNGIVDCIPETKALKLFASVNELLEKYGLEPMQDSNLICKNEE